jgi:hypothetical protein
LHMSKLFVHLTPVLVALSQMGRHPKPVAQAAFRAAKKGRGKLPPSEMQPVPMHPRAV